MTCCGPIDFCRRNMGGCASPGTHGYGDWEGGEGGEGAASDDNHVNATKAQLLTEPVEELVQSQGCGAGRRSSWLDVVW